ncbi:MAG TPA: dienelactone hydrolase family protein [Bacillales bacterium]|nr:dienelactone hydrolase family protein [Bacillales bacterium]
MSLHTEWIRYGENEVYSGYVARSENVERALPTVIVLQEIWGLDEHIQDVTRRYAQAGYVAFAPDLYAKNGERETAYKGERIEAVKSFLNSVPPAVWHDQEKLQKELAKLPKEKGKQIQETFSALFGGLDLSNYQEQLLATSAFLRNEYEPSLGKAVGSVGFCMGGGLSALLAGTDEKLVGAIIFYGQPPEDEVVQSINCPVLGFYGELDERITSKVPELAEKMKRHGKSFEYHVYDGAQHAFFNDTRASYNVDAVRDSFARALGFFKEQLV